jgi:hypothetical protein
MSLGRQMTNSVYVCNLIFMSVTIQYRVETYMATRMAVYYISLIP